MYITSPLCIFVLGKGGKYNFSSVRNIFNLALKQYFFFVVFLFIVTMLWHVTPHFICDIIFYYIVWQTLGYNVLLAPFLACMRFLGGGQAQFQMHIQHGVGQQQRPTP